MSTERINPWSWDLLLHSTILTFTSRNVWDRGPCVSLIRSFRDPYCVESSWVQEVPAPLPSTTKVLHARSSTPYTHLAPESCVPPRDWPKTLYPGRGYQRFHWDLTVSLLFSGPLQSPPCDDSRVPSLPPLGLSPGRPRCRRRRDGKDVDEEVEVTPWRTCLPDPGGGKEENCLEVPGSVWKTTGQTVGWRSKS